MQKAQKTRKTWRDALASGPLILPGAYDALSAKLIEKSGFEAFIIGGFPLVASRYGLPDIGLAGLGEMAAGVKDILTASTRPVLVDGDNGYGDVKNTVHTVRTYEAMGASALLLEDQASPKRCGHLAGKDVVPTEVMINKLRAASQSRESSDLFILARTDARAVHGLDDALSRAEKYLNAGADGIFIEAPQSLEELEVIGRTFDVPQMCNMLVGGKTPLVKSRELFEMGFQMVVHGTTLVKCAARAVQKVLDQLKADQLVDDNSAFIELEAFMEVVDFARWREVEDTFAGIPSEHTNSSSGLARRK